MRRTILAAALVVCAVSQAEAARLAGYVTDEEGQALSGADIEVTGPGAVGVHHARSDERGFYEMPGLPPYQTLRVRASMPGRVPVIYSGLQAREGHGTRRDFRLRPPGRHEVLILLDDRVPYHRTTLEGARLAAPGAVTVIEIQGTSREDERSLRQAMEKRPQAVLAIGSDAARLARRVVHDVPVVYTMVMDPKSDGVDGLNFCGAPLNDGFDGNLDQLMAMKPGARRIVTLYDPRRLAQAVGKLRRAAEARGMTLDARPAREASHAVRALERLRHGKKRHDAFYLLLDPRLIDAGTFERIRQYAADREMVFIVPDTSLVAAGGTFSFSPGFREMGSHAGQVASHVVFKGAQPLDIGSVFPSIRYFALNPVEAERLALAEPALSP